MTGLVSALFTGGSGLRSNAKWSEITARNISNANTEGYVKKETHFSTRGDKLGGGVYVSEIRREVNSSLDRMHRYENAKMERQRAIFESIEEYTSILGQPSDQKSPSFKLSEFKSSIVRLANNPSNTSVQREVVTQADNVTISLREATEALAQIESEVVMELNYDIADLNDSLYRIADLNTQLSYHADSTSETADTLDEIGRLVDKISSLMNIRTTTGPGGRVNIYSGGGTPLLEGTSVNEIYYNQGTGEMYAGAATAADGGKEITPFKQGVRSFEYGKIAGLIEVRNVIIPKFQLQLDEMARSLVEGFQNVDNSLIPSDAGLFTNNGMKLITDPTDPLYDPTAFNKLAGRIQVNNLVKPENGGHLSRIRDGIGTSPNQGPASNVDQIENFLTFFDSALNYDGGTEIPSGVTIETYANNMVSLQQTQRTYAEDEFESIQVSAEAIQQARLSEEGVNIDDELQKLIVIEQSYAANSQLMKTVAQMMDQLMNIL